MTEEGETLYMDIYDNGLVSNEYKEKFKHLINNFYTGVEENERLAKHILELQKQKGELIDENKKLIDMATNSVTVRSYTMVKQATEIIRALLSCLEDFDEDTIFQYKQYMEKAKQYLKENSNG